MSATAMPGYVAGRACAKCGDHGADTAYLTGPDTLRRACQRCGYSWSELPLDRAPESAGRLP